MNILVIGSGGREHAISWKLAQSDAVKHVFVAPGNGGTAYADKTRNVPIAADDIRMLLDFAQDNDVQLTVVGPELPLVAGIVDVFQHAGLAIFGPSAQATRLEGSKAFAKTFMIEEGIPTAPATIFSQYAAAQAYLDGWEGPCVVKADGLAAGKGVLMCDTVEQARAALRLMMIDRAFGKAADKVLIETRLYGEEMSLLAFSDGHTVIPMLSARDYKRALDGDRGLNTGGMGGYAPSTLLPRSQVDGILARVIQPVVDGMARRGTPYVGILYAGLMLTDGGPKVLEFNCRFGDPETQILMPLLNTDLVDILLACIHGNLSTTRIRWKDACSVGVVLASGGYPGHYRKGKIISGCDRETYDDVVIFHAGTSYDNNHLVTSGGRVCTVTALGKTIAAARQRAYTAIQNIEFPEMQFRSDIAANTQTGESLPELNAPVFSAYTAAGVDIDAGEKAVALMREAVQATYTPEVLKGIGAFGGSISINTLAQHYDLVLVSSTDGVGTKTRIATEMGNYDTIGHDIVNHCVNDILVQGARPLFFLDYIASSKLDPVVIATVVKGCAVACQQVGCVLIGGETAEMPGVYEHGALDLVGTMVGWVDKKLLVDGKRISAGDVCVGLPSSGLHTNGFSLARHVFRDVGWDIILPELENPLGEVLLTPHKAYLHDVERLWNAGVDIKAMSHLTGGSFIENIPRVLPGKIGVHIDRATWQVPPIFSVIQERGRIQTAEMYRVFNMGIGFILILDVSHLDKVLETLPEAVAIGETVPWDGQYPRVLIQET